ncbi:MAG: FHA domain-containing protein [Deltaproteobacteria bacterium]|nr:FHA domain-containing protein [Deltaproteobacteria bacterium]
MAELSVHTIDGKTSTYLIEKGEIIIGRAPESDILIPDYTVSRTHASLRKTLRGYLLKDLDSHNGTYVNGSQIKEHILEHGDEVKVGTATIVFLDKVPRARLVEDSAEQKEEEVLRKAPRVGELDSQQDLLISARRVATARAGDSETTPERRRSGPEHARFVDLEKSNKILYVLYQISRKLNTVPDFDQLLSAIMDSIFEVIDADYGFVALLGKSPDELVPKVVKYRISSKKSGGEMKVSRTILNRVVHEKASVLTSDAMEDSRFQGAKSIFVQNIRSAMSVPLWRKNEVIGIIQLHSSRLTNKFTRADLDLLTTISNQVAMVIEQAELNEKIRRETIARTRLERFHSPEVVDLIIHGEDLESGALVAPTEKIATILFSDIVSFTPLSERLSPGEVSLLLNHYFREMTDIIFKYNGTLDKYIGDAIMAVFGAPIEREDDPERAVRAALDMRKTLSQMMEEIEPDRRFSIRLGINTGRVVAGNLGSPKRMDYTVIGDTVNTASRLETLAEPNQILIGEKTYRSVKNMFRIRQIGEKKLKGKSKPIKVYEVLG